MDGEPVVRPSPVQLFALSPPPSLPPSLNLVRSCTGELFGGVSGTVKMVQGNCFSFSSCAMHILTLDAQLLQGCASLSKML